MTVILRAPLESDWDAILEAANASAPWADNSEWFERRKAFVDFSRRHYVVENIESDRVIGYGAIEGEKTQGKFRIFVVMSPDLLPTIGEQMYRQLEMDLLDLNAEIVWAREAARDPLLVFFRDHGFNETLRFHHDQMEIVVMEKTVYNITQERNSS
jgi:L-amino acid N-acyltransferase YncA